MGTIGYTYGSEWHLLRFLGYHRDALNRAVEESIPGSTVLDWSGSGYETGPAAVDREPPRFLDREFEGLGFLPQPQRERLLPELGRFWPMSGSLPNWDAVGRIKVGGEEGWLLVEAKSHLGEIKSSCGARPESEGGGRDQIGRAFRQTQEHLGISVGPEAWLGPFYQFCNRLAFLHFLTSRGIPTRLLFLYFLGDRFPSSSPACCPDTEAGWQEALGQMNRHTGWGPDNPLSGRVHRVFLPVSPAVDR
jgi:hypothetical protein